VRIVLTAVSSNRSMSGVSRHAANLAKCLLMRSDVSALHVLVAPWEEKYLTEAIARNDRRLCIHPVPLQPGTLHRNSWYYRRLPAIAEQLRADLVHLAYPSPIRAGAFRCPTVVTLHDLYPYDIPDNFGFPKVLFNRITLRQCLQNASAVVCVSNSTKLRLGVRMPQTLPKAVTIFNCVESGPTPRKPFFAATWKDQPFLLCVAQHRRNKNVLLALRVFKRLLANQMAAGMRLVVVGLPGPESGKIHRFAKVADLVEHVTFVDGISDPELHWCYRNCELLLAPSTTEGFGLPVAEAQLAGCRIVCSDIPAFREVGSVGCRFVPLNANAEEEFASKIVASLCFRRPLPAWLPQFSPSAIADQHLRLYNYLLTRSDAQAITTRAAKEEEVQPESSLSHRLPTAARF
jgi:glycosyltransferase involved in cell wall biosynthesis